MQYYKQPEKEIPIMGDYDVVVVGGGCAGVAAAIAAARNGAHTLIMEQFPFFGGTATASLMANIVGIRNQVKPNDLQVMKGVGEELVLKLLERKGAVVTQNAYISEGPQHANVKGDLSYSYAFDTEIFKDVALKMVLEAKADILFHVYFSDVMMENERVTGVIYEGKSGREAVKAKVVIDASGDADVAARAGVPFWQTKGGEAKRLNDTLMLKLRDFSPNVTLSSCVHQNDMVVWGPKVCNHNGADTRELTQIEIEARAQAFDFVDQMRAQHPELANARIAETGCLMGIRQTRFIEGEYQITGEDVLEGHRFDDCVAMAANPVIEYYGYRRFLTHEGYDIPYRCLVPQKVDGLLVAGRCMSSDQIAYESWRAMANVLCIGEAAGTAAAMTVQQHTQPRNVDIAALRSQLISQGAEIGQGRTM
ncbi:MAG: FAD-dependent oxidoreductase [Eubacteriales bacterium]|nr:FAD-dependent oxidoreductase [Eubacteriales bacterium]